MNEESVEAEIASLKFNDEQLAARVRRMEKFFDTLDTPVWKRVLFLIDGWPKWYRISERPQWRPWRRWGRS